MSAPANVLPSVRDDSYLTLHYRLSDADGNEFVSTFELSPATLQMGAGQLAVPLERCLLGLTPGERRIFELAPDEAFGERNPRLVERIARSALPLEAADGQELRINSLIEFESSEHDARFSGVLRELSETSALIDFNHPLAGKAVRFEVEIIGIL